MPTLAKGFGCGLGLGLGLGLNQRILSFAATKAFPSFRPQPTATARIPQVIRRSPIIQAARNVQTSARQVSSKGSKSAKATTSHPKPLDPMSRDGLELAKRLAATGRPTILCKAPSHFWLLFSSISAATFCVTYALFNYWYNVAHPPANLAWWVPHSFAFICLFMAMLGLRFIWSSSYIVRRITAIPRSQLPKSFLTGGADGKAGKLSPAHKRSLDAIKASPIALECELRKTIPLLPPQKIIVAPNEVQLPFKMAEKPCGLLSGTRPPPPPAQDFIGRTIARPFEALRVGPSGVWKDVRRGLTAEGLSPIKIKDIKYKIDITGGEMLAKGDALDALVTQRPPAEFKSGVLERLLRN